MTDEQKASGSAEDVYFEAVRKAFLRGAEWHRQYGDDPLISKAAYDHADGATSTASLPAALTPELAAKVALGAGVKVVPLDPTDAMVDAALQVDWSNEDERGAARNVWRAMVTAAPDITPEPAADTGADEMVERLRGLSEEWADGPVYDPSGWEYRLLNEAADLITALQSECARLRAEIAAKADERERMIAALRVLVDAVGRYVEIGPLRGVCKDLERGLEMGRSALDPDLGRLRPGRACKHGVRWPHACDDCDRAALAARAAIKTEG